MTAAPSRPAACPTCCPVAVRSPTPRRGSTWPPPGASSTCPRRPAATPTRSSPRPPPASSAAWSSAASTPTTWPTRPPPARRSRPPASWSASRSRESEVTRAADVVFPVAPVTDRAGTFVNWEGRVRPFGKVLHNAGVAARPAGPGRHRRGARRTRWASGPAEQVWDEMDAGRPVGRRAGRRDRPRRRDGRQRAQARPTGEALALASWKQLLDDGRMQDGDEAMRATARKPVACSSARDAAPRSVPDAGDRHAERTARLGRPPGRGGRPRRRHRVGARPAAPATSVATSSAPPGCRGRP